MNIKVSKAKESDGSELEKLFLSIRQSTFKWEDPGKYKIEDFRDSTRGEKILVAKEKGEIAGFISIYEPDNFIHNLFIDPRFQRMGVGRLLLEKIIKGLAHATLKTDIYNFNACAFYEKHGFVRLSTHDGSPPYHLYSYKNLEVSER